MGSPSVGISAEDRYAIVNMASESRLMPDDKYFENLAKAARRLDASWDFLWDFREGTPYNDIVDALSGAVDLEAGPLTVVVAPDNKEQVRIALSGLRHAVQIVPMRRRALPKHSFDLTGYAEKVMSEEAARLVGYEQAREASRGDSEPGDGLWEAIEDGRFATLRNFLESIAIHSTLVELALFADGDGITVVPYHAHSLHQVHSSADDLVLVRPGRVNRRYWRRFQRQLDELEALINAPRVKEREIEVLLLSNPLFLQGLNFRAVYPQVVLPRPDGTHLKPDLIVEPMESEWAEIVELKLPSQPILVGKDNRVSLAHGITSVASQLREYSAYFDDREVAARVERAYGFKCYKPRLVAVVGRDVSNAGDDEVRRAMTAHPDLEIVSYDQLLRAARNRLLL
jgi:hypothetical protein